MLDQADSIALDVLRHCRAQMIQDFLDEKPAIYGPSYKHEKSSAMLNLAIDKYFTAWLSGHWKVFLICVDACSIEEKKQFERVFAKVFISLLDKWSVLKFEHPTQVHFGLTLIDDMQKAIAHFIKAGEKADLMRNKLEVAMEKNSTLFDRMISQQRGKES